MQALTISHLVINSCISRLPNIDEIQDVVTFFSYCISLVWGVNVEKREIKYKETTTETYFKLCA